MTENILWFIGGAVLSTLIYWSGYWMGAHHERRYWVKFIDEHLKAMKA